MDMAEAVGAFMVLNVIGTAWYLAHSKRATKKLIAPSPVSNDYDHQPEWMRKHLDQMKKDTDKG